MSEKPKITGRGCGLGCAGIFILLSIIGYISNIAGCNDSSNAAFSAGFSYGQSAGEVDGAPGRTAPSEDVLNSAARRVLTKSDYANASESLQEDYMRGFKSGYESGFKKASKPAF